jgi:hypothetical protein
LIAKVLHRECAIDLRFCLPQLARIDHAGNSNVKLLFDTAKMKDLLNLKPLVGKCPLGNRFVQYKVFDLPFFLPNSMIVPERRVPDDLGKPDRTLLLEGNRDLLTIPAAAGRFSNQL